jgi:uncharacterized protein GlcG (DUF336 family)
MMTDDDAVFLVNAAIERAKAMNIKITAAVVDPSGYLVALRRMDKAGFLTPQIAEAKAFSAAAWGTPISTIAERARAKPETFQAFAGVGRTRLIPGQGGAPVRRAGEIVGALGISGGSGAEDDDICGTALAAFDERA